MKKQESYRWAAKQVRAQIKRHSDLIATLANITAILNDRFSYFFWVGFYFLKDHSLVLGPFQGPPACMVLNLEKGVCAAAVKERKTILVPDVHRFPGHIACDSRSKSEIVVPCFDTRGIIQAVLDVDSEKAGAFDQIDQSHLEGLVASLAPIWENIKVKY